MHKYLSQTLLSNAILATTQVTTSADTTELSSVAKIIADYGVTVVVCAIMLIFMWRYMNNILKRDNKLFEEVSPKLDSLEKHITELNTTLSTLISNHNAHSNNSLHAVERDLTDIRKLLLENQDQLRDIAGSLTNVQNGIEVLFRVTVNNKYGSIDQSHSIEASSHYEHYDVDHYHRDVVSDSGSNRDKK